MISGDLADKCDLEDFQSRDRNRRTGKNKAFAEFCGLIISARESHPVKALLSFLS
jgi:hypothetical protein